MMARIFNIFFIIFFPLCPLIVLGQNKGDSRRCYIESFPDKSEVFDRIENNPEFKGGYDALLNFLTENISFPRLVNDLKKNERDYADTARIKFIMSRTGVMSDLSVTQTKKQVFKEEIIRVIKKSSCKWNPGNFSGRYIDGWFQIDVYYNIDRKFEELAVKIGFKPYEFVTD